MRIIRGQYGGRTFNIKIQAITRPTSNFAKEALFNKLCTMFDIEKIVVLDLFAGIGSIGFEFASLGAQKVIMVDTNQHSITILKHIKSQLQATNVAIQKNDVFRFLANQIEQWDIVFADPPYDFDDYERLVHHIVEQSVLKAQGIFILEHYKKNVFTHLPTFTEMRNYGDTSFSFFKK